MNADLRGAVLSLKIRGAQRADVASLPHHAKTGALGTPALSPTWFLLVHKMLRLAK
jgi:hypothetical protein